MLLRLGLQIKYTRTRAGIQDICSQRAKNFELKNLYVTYDSPRQLSLLNLGLSYETLFAASLATKKILIDVY